MRETIQIYILRIRNDELYIAGNLPDYRKKEEKIFAVDESGKKHALSIRRARPMDTRRRKHKIRGYLFEVSLPVNPGARYHFACRSDGSTQTLTPAFGEFSRLTDDPYSYFRYGNCLIKRSGSSIIVCSDKLTTRLANQYRYNQTLRKQAPAEVIRIRKQAEKLRKSSKPIWIVSDRSEAAGDSGEALFEYLCSTDAKDKYDISFLISTDSPDYDRMRQIGPVIPVGSEEHIIKFLAASLLISSAADDWVMNPLGDDRKYYQDLISSKYVFLQHGVIKDDLSNWLFLLKKNLSIFITSTQREWESICSGGYGYGPDVVKLTGLARYDRLENRPEKKITIMPTWRQSLAPERKGLNSEREYSETFRDSEYCRFYNRLINDPVLLETMREKGYTGTFYLHPNHRKQWTDFKGNDTISVCGDLVPYRQIFGECELLITDYSSVAIDFAYLGKPVVYTQFDSDEFYAGHSYDKGYYDYERDGFGPVCYNYEDSLASIVSVIENGCANDTEYVNRADSFFAYRDHDNCRRIYEELIRL